MYRLNTPRAPPPRAPRQRLCSSSKAAPPRLQNRWISIR